MNRIRSIWDQSGGAIIGWLNIPSALSAEALARCGYDGLLFDLQHGANDVASAAPHFLLHAEDDDAVPVANTLMLRAALQARGIATQTHLFGRGGHGFGLRKAKGLPVAVWPELFFAWAISAGLR